MTDAFILEATRTAVGKRSGHFSHIRPDDLAGLCLNGLVDRAGVAPVEVEDVVMGCVTQIDEQGLNIGRTAVLAAGWPVTVPGVAVNRMCSSSLQSTHFAAQAVMSGMMDLTVGAGVESMTRVNMGGDAGPISERINDRFDVVGQGISAELISERYGFSRSSLEELALESHRRANNAIDQGYFKREILPVEVPDGNGGTILVETDQGPRRNTTLEKLASLKPVFRDDGVITAAVASQISDGAAALLLGSKAKADALGVRPKARIRSMSVVGTDPTMMLLGPAPATEKALQKAGMKLSDIDLFEVNEAFAPVVLAWQQEMGANLDITNVNGGAMALGHPLGCTGARLLVTLLHELERRDLNVGLATLCVGWGLGVATIIERV
jgi:acetyl-CoA acetyltransferase family protein